jgi:hypothetical protein
LRRRSLACRARRRLTAAISDAARQRLAFHLTGWRKRRLQLAVSLVGLRRRFAQHVTPQLRE